MGYILHLLDTQGIDDADAAEQWLVAQHKLPPEPSPGFAAFVQQIQQTYPDLSDEDEDGDNEANLWEEGLDTAASYGKVKELVVKVDLTDQAVIAALAAAALQQGLILYDAEGQLIYTG